MSYHEKYLKYKTKYLNFKNDIFINSIDDYDLIGIGEFNHGMQNIWDYRFNLLKQVMKNTNKNITIFNEMSVWQAENIMNDTIYDHDNDKFIKYKNIKLEIESQKTTSEPAWGELWQYCNHSLESKIFLEIIKFIRKNKKRISIIGIDNDTLARDHDMYKIIIKNLNLNNINFLWAHNFHIDDRKLDDKNYAYTKDKFPNLKHTCGHYLKQKLKDKYCIILSQAAEGEIRFNGVCIGESCETRIWTMKYFYKEFDYLPNKKYILKNVPYKLYDNFNDNLIEFSNSYNADGFNGGYIIKIKKPKYNYVLFFNKINKLVSYKEY